MHANTASMSVGMVNTVNASAHFLFFIALFDVEHEVQH